MQILQVKEVTVSPKGKLGNQIKNAIEHSEEIVQDEEIKKVIDRILLKIADKHNIDAAELNLLLVNNPQVN
ncbi:hypothetical protein SAMN05661096_04061 [Marivirga sericea]|uniref:Uncharacterized protein n=1 Tax=Marivirga sericea TaxID=1028 RepID=A0A1X7LI94_9BACT|nr:hypothetical protein [Marivirga sericea]SMG53214.1 hypothetical protein SAMN05661096_04061 [Marivirga sericea]